MSQSFLSACPRSHVLLSVPLVIALGGALAGVGVGAASASTAQVQSSNGQLYYTADAGEQNDVTITQTDVGTFTITDPGATITPGEGCTVDGATATCSDTTATAYVYVTLGDGDDTALVDASVQSYLEGGDGDDTLTNVTGPGNMVGGLGDDKVTGGPARDSIVTGLGADRVTAGAGDDFLYPESDTNGADGDDTINMGAGNDVIYTGAGNQDVHGGEGTDTVYYYHYYYYYGADLTVSLDDVPNDGNPAVGESDNIHSDVETLWTGSGDDTITGSEAADTFNSGNGNDVVKGAGGRDRLQGSSGDDILFGGADNDRINGEAGNDTADGGGGDDYLEGSDLQGDDLYNGGAGVDFIAIYRDNDVSVTLDDLPNDGEAGEADNVMSNVEDIFTGAGNDRIIGTIASNNLSGGAGDDIIRGRDGNDELDGDLGRDTLFGGRGTDSIAGGGNVDTITSQDRSADYVTCGSSIDSLNHDRHDQVAVDCETLS